MDEVKIIAVIESENRIGNIYTENSVWKWEVYEKDGDSFNLIESGEAANEGDARKTLKEKVYETKEG